MERIYISGPITGTVDAEERFGEAEEILRKKYLINAIVNPLRVGQEADTDASMTHDEYMHISFAMMDLCNAVYMLDGWRNSKGACMEYGYARAKGAKILYETQEPVHASNISQPEKQGEYVRIENSAVFL